MNSAHLWLAAALVCLSIEALQGGPLVFVFLALACGVCSVGCWVQLLPDFWQQACIFFLTSAAGLSVLRPVMTKISKKGEPVPSGEIGSPIGSAGTALSGALPGQPLRVEVFGTPWSAMLVGSDPLVKGQRCRVVGFYALTLSVEAISE